MAKNPTVLNLIDEAEARYKGDKNLCPDCEYGRPRIIDHTFQYWCDLHNKYEIVFDNVKRSFSLRKTECSDFPINKKKDGENS
jgi:hypothetical protein